MVFIHMGSTTGGKFSDETGLTTSNRTHYQVLFLFRIPNVSEEKYGNDESVCQK